MPVAAHRGRADIRSGQVHESVLQTMLNLASHYRVGIGVVRSGHPLDVVGTSRPSNHPIGLAFDTWRIDDQPVVAATTPRALVMAYRQAAVSLGSYNVGGRSSRAGRCSSATTPTTTMSTSASAPDPATYAARSVDPR